MMNFLDLSAASEEERRLIREYLSDTSVVKIAEGNTTHNTNLNHRHQQQLQRPHQQQQQQQQPHINTTNINNISNSSNNINANNNSNTSVCSGNISSTANHGQTTNNFNNKTSGSTNGSNNLPTRPTAIYNRSRTKYNNNQHHAPNHLNHQAPLVTPTAKLEPKSASSNSNTSSSNANNSIGGNLKNQSYPTHDTSNSIQTLTTTATPTNATTLQNNTTISSIQNAITGAQPVPQATQMPPMAGDMNSVIAMDMTSTQPQGYAIPYPPPPHQIYSPHIFQHPHNPYYICYNLHPPYVPFVIPQNSVVPPRQQAPPQSNQPPNTTTAINSHSRPHSHHLVQQSQQNHEQYNIMMNGQTNQHQESKGDGIAPIADLTPSHRSQNLKKNGSERDLNEIQKSSSAGKTSIINSQSEAKPSLSNLEKTKNVLLDSESSSENHLLTEVYLGGHEQDTSNEDKSMQSPSSNNIKTNNSNQKNSSSSGAKNKITVPNHRGERSDNHMQKAEIDSVTSQTRVQPPIKSVQSYVRGSVKNIEARNSSTTTKSNEHLIKVSSDEGFETQSSLDVSKQSHESSASTSYQTNKSFLDNCNKSALEKLSNEPSELMDNANEVPQRAGPWGSASSKSWADLFKRKDSALLDSSVNGENELNVSESEYSEEENKTQRSTSKKAEASVKANNTITASKQDRSQEAAKRAMDKMAPALAQKINSINLKHALPFLKPRGFINKGNGCYINATLQALIACPPFYNLMKEIGDLRGFRRDNSCTPILDSFAELFLNFPPLDANKKVKPLVSQDQKLHINSLQAEAIEPKCIYNVLGQIKSECLKGAQEDAEEFLSSVLNGLHEEMISLLQVPQDSSNQNGHSSDVEDSNDSIANDDNLWREVGPKNRSLPIRTAKVIHTPIQEIFGGSLFSIRTAGKDRCGHRSPFFDLQLDISGDNVKSVQDAIKSFTALEIIHDFYCSKTKQKLDAQRRTSLDQLPPILILHLKQFVYTQDHGLKKLIKKIEYPIDFELPECCLHEKNYTDKNLKSSRSYKLLAAVYHDGKEAIKGHYLTDVYHIGSSQWIRCDDSNLKVIPAPRIEHPDASRTPYLLFYRRLNTLRAQTDNHENKKKN